MSISNTDEVKTEAFLTNENGHKLFCKYWSKGSDAPKPRALLFIAHGLAEHCLHYEEIANMLTKEGFYAFSHDHQGHGQSEGSRCLNEDVRHYTRDVFMHIDEVKKQFPDLPVFIIGHSMGGCITIMSVIDQPDYFKGVLLLSPLLISKNDSAGPVKVFFGKLIARVIPQFPVLWIKSTELSRDPVHCQKCEDDPLQYHGAMKARTGMSLLKATQEIESKLDTIQVPFFIIHGSHDKIIPVEGSKMMYEKAASKDKTLKIYDNCFHQVHHELDPNKSEALEEIRQWMCKQLK